MITDGGLDETMTGVTTVDLTLYEAAQLIEPAIGVRTLRRLVSIRELGIKPIGTRPTRNPQGGRPHLTYDYAELVQLADALKPWLTRSDKPSSS